MYKITKHPLNHIIERFGIQLFILILTQNIRLLKMLVYLIIQNIQDTTYYYDENMIINSCDSYVNQFQVLHTDNRCIINLTTHTFYA